jgi:hypothetical protein
MEKVIPELAIFFFMSWRILTKSVTFLFVHSRSFVHVKFSFWYVCVGFRWLSLFDLVASMFSLQRHYHTHVDCRNIYI